MTPPWSGHITEYTSCPARARRGPAVWWCHGHQDLKVTVTIWNIYHIPYSLTLPHGKAPTYTICALIFVSEAFPTPSPFLQFKLNDRYILPSGGHRWKHTYKILSEPRSRGFSSLLQKVTASQIAACVIQKTQKSTEPTKTDARKYD